MALVLIPWFIPFDQTVVDMYLELCDRMEQQPEKTFVLLAIENDQIQGMVIAYCRKDDVFIWQASTDRGVSVSVVDHAFRGILCWAKGKGYSQVSGVPNRARKIWQRRWGFQSSETNDQEVFVEI